MAENGTLDPIAATRALIEKVNARVRRIKAATEDKSKRVHDLRAESDDEKVVKFRAYEEKVLAELEAATNTIDAYITENLLGEVEAVDVEAEKAAYAEDKKKAAAALGFVEIMGLDLPEDFPKIEGLRGSGAGAGTGAKRPRLSMITVDGAEVYGERPGKGKDGKPDGTTVRTHTFTDLARFLKKESEVSVSASDLQAHAFESAGTNDLSEKPGQTFNFTITLGEGDKSHTYSVDFTPADPDAATE